MAASSVATPIGNSSARRSAGDSAAFTLSSDGKTHTVATQASRGSAANPLKDAEIEDKLRIEADSWQKGHDIQPLIDAVWPVDRSEDVSALAKLSVPG